MTTGTPRGIFERNVPGMTERLDRATVAIAGCGGLGSNVAVALTRAGVGHLILADRDAVEASNLNRQAFNAADIGRRKVTALADHLREIRPDLALTLHDTEVTRDNVATLFGGGEILVEAFDDAAAKILLIEAWTRAFPDRTIVCGNGLAGVGRTAALKVVRTGHIVFCGDMESDMALGLSAPRVAMVAAMQANEVCELLMGDRT
jgi:sulfur carrier protein ThiS adenylyltransferase